MDSLTHILNAETSLKRIVEDLDTMPEGQSGALLLIDIDKFKLINDNYGHLEGDSILKQFALLLRDSFSQRRYRRDARAEMNLLFI